MVVAVAAVVVLILVVLVAVVLVAAVVDVVVDGYTHLPAHVIVLSKRDPV